MNSIKRHIRQYQKHYLLIIFFSLYILDLFITLLNPTWEFNPFIKKLSNENRVNIVLIKISLGFGLLLGFWFLNRLSQKSPHFSAREDVTRHKNEWMIKALLFGIGSYFLLALWNIWALYTRLS